jgi:hypothetical protein
MPVTPALNSKITQLPDSVSEVIQHYIIGATVIQWVAVYSKTYCGVDLR